MKYSLINKIYNLPYSNLLSGFIKKRLLKKNNITFIPTNKKKLPKRNYPVQNTLEYQEKIIKSYNKNKTVSFNTCPDLKNALVAKSNIFVMPSIIHKTSVEGFGIAYVEAAQYGIPSLGGKDGGASDAIDHDKTGLICDGNNLDEIYSSLNSMIENKKYIELGKNAKEHVSKFQWDKTFEEYKKILN